jgi:DNA-binding NarL/FixJ family response regulator
MNYHPHTHEIHNHETGPAVIRLLLVHQRALFRETLGRLLGAEPGFNLIAECASPLEGLDVLKGATVDVVLLDLGGQGAVDFIPAAHDAGYEGKFLMVTPSVDAASSALALKLGASGIFLESNSSNRLLHAVRLVASGEAWLDHSLIQLLADAYPRASTPFDDSRVRISGLTSRQQTVVQGVVDGLSNRKIADRLGISEGTVKSTLQQLFAKVGVRTRSQLVRAALEGALVHTAGATSHEHAQKA